MSAEPEAPVPTAAPGLVAQLTEYLQLCRSQCLQQLQLLSLETQRAAESLVAICVLGLFAALLLLSSWGLLLLLLWTVLQALGLLPWQGLLLLLLLQLLVFALCLRYMRYLSHFLSFPATVQSWTEAPLQPHNTQEPPCPSAPLP